MMNINVTSHARVLANYISSLEDFKIEKNYNGRHTKHIGAILTDVILQAGLNYNTVVKPRIERIEVYFADYNTVNKFYEILIAKGPEKVIRWKSLEKINRLKSLLEFFNENAVNEFEELSKFMQKDGNLKKLLKINGIGYKSVDYLLKLLGEDTVAVDRHLVKFVEEADITAKGYYEIKRIVQFSADLLNIKRCVLDYSIWSYMSEKSPTNSRQIEINFR